MLKANTHPETAAAQNGLQLTETKTSSDSVVHYFFLGWFCPQQSYHSGKHAVSTPTSVKAWMDTDTRHWVFRPFYYTNLIQGIPTSPLILSHGFILWGCVVRRHP